MKTLLKKWQWVLVGVTVLFVLTNPTQSDFNNFSKLQAGRYYEVTLTSRTEYFLIFSIYENKILGKNTGSVYLGVFKNFILISTKNLTKNEII